MKDNENVVNPMIATIEDSLSDKPIIIDVNDNQCAGIVSDIYLTQSRVIFNSADIGSQLEDQIAERNRLLNEHNAYTNRTITPFSKNFGFTLLVNKENYDSIKRKVARYNSSVEGVYDPITISRPLTLPPVQYSYYDEYDHKCDCEYLSKEVLYIVKGNFVCKYEHPNFIEKMFCSKQIQNEEQLYKRFVRIVKDIESANK